MRWVLAVKYVLAKAAFATVALMALGLVGAGLAFGQSQSASGMAAMDRNMLLGAGVLIATQWIVVGVAVAWYVRGLRESNPPDESSAARLEARQDAAL